MKLGVVVDTFPCLSETFIARELQALHEQGVPFELFAFRTPPVPPSPGGDPSFHPAPHPLPHGLSGWLHTIQLPGMARAMAVCPPPCRCYLPAALTLAVTARHHGITHLHAEFAAHTACAARMAAHRNGHRYSVSAHAHDLFTQSDRFLQAALESACWVRTCTQQGKEKVRRLFPDWPDDRIIHIPHGIFPERYEPTLPNGNHILAVGRLVPKKGWFDLLASLAILRDQAIPFTCTLVGEGPQRRVLESTIARLQLARHITLTGACTEPEVIAWYGRTDLLVVPSIQTPDGDRDGIPNVILEAMAMGRCVIGTQTGGIPEIIRDNRNGVLVPAGQPALLATTIARLIQDPDQRRRLGEQARSDVIGAYDVRRTIRPLGKRLMAAVQEGNTTR